MKNYLYFEGKEYDLVERVGIHYLTTPLLSKKKPKLVHLEKHNFKVDSKGWKEVLQNGITYKINPAKDITEYVSGVSKELIGQQLFTWDAAMRETKKAGKRIPTDEEFDKLKKELLINPVYAGYRLTDGSFYYRGAYTSFWSSSESGTSAWKRNLNSGYSTVYRIAGNKAYGFSVKCIKN